MNTLGIQIERALIKRAKNIVRSHSISEFRRKSDTGLFCINHKRVKADIHHVDYNDFRNVMFLCKECHKEWHQKNEAVGIDLDTALHMINQHGIGASLDRFLVTFGIDQIVESIDKAQELLSSIVGASFDDWANLSRVRESIIWKQATKHLQISAIDTCP